MARDTLVFDIQTVPDTEAARHLLEHPEFSDAEACEALSNYFSEKQGGGNDFLRAPFHQVVSISYAYLMCERDEDGLNWVLKRIASGGTEESSEKELLEGFFHLIETRSPRLVSFNGRSFALPVLKYRAMKYGLSCPRWFSTGDRWNNYDARYSTMYHVDLLEVLSDYGASTRCSMNEIAAALNLPLKLERLDSHVEGLIAPSDLSVIRGYGETDVCSMLLIFLRWELFQGVLNDAAYANLMQTIRNYLSIESEEREYFGSFLMMWD